MFKKLKVQRDRERKEDSRERKIAEDESSTDRD